MIRKIKQKIKNLLAHSLKETNNKISLLDTKVTTKFEEVNNQKVSQKQLFAFYQDLHRSKKQLPDIKDVGFRIYSQTDEDGILLYLFSLIGFTNKICLDIAFASPYGSNTTNLIVNHGFNGILICGDENEKQHAESWFASNPNTQIFPPVTETCFVTQENINDTVSAGLKKLYTTQDTIDLLSLDIDGVDYWIWKALNVVKARVVIVEYQDILGASAKQTVPYKADFNRFEAHEDFCGASLSAFVELAKSKGYRFVGTNQYGYNAFFVLEELCKDILDECVIDECFKHPKVKWGIANRYPNIKNHPWVNI